MNNYPVIKMTFLFCAAMLVGLSGCKNENHRKQGSEGITTAKKETLDTIEVVSNGMDFQVPSRINSGWTTFIYNNKSAETHFFVFEKLPEGITFENYKNDLVPPIKKAFTHLINDEVENAMEEFGKLPSWWNDVKMGGGVGLISPKSKAESTIYMDPGTYVMECYVRMPDGMPHAFFGMLKEIVVSEEKNEKQEPSSDHRISVSSDAGIAFQDSIQAGEYQLAVAFKDQKQYETLLGHDVNLVRLDNRTKLDTLGSWLNATNIEAFRTPVPAGLTFLGGVEDLEGGETGYFRARLNKGSYVLISEVPNALERNMYKTFKVY